MVEKVPLAGRALCIMVVEEYLGEDTKELYTFDTTFWVASARTASGLSSPPSSAGQRRSWSCKFEAIGNGQRAKILIEDIRLFVPPPQRLDKLRLARWGRGAVFVRRQREVPAARSSIFTSFFGEPK